MADLEAVLEAERRGILPPDRQEALNEARKRGLVPARQEPPPADQPEPDVAPVALPAESPAEGLTEIPFSGDPGTIAQERPPEVEEEIAPLGERIGASIEARSREFDEIVSADQTPAETALQIAGKTIVGGGLDIAGDVAESALDVAGDVAAAVTPDPILDMIEEGTDAALEWVLGSDLGQMGLEAARAGVEAWEEFKSENPRAARNIESVVNVGLVAAPASSALRIGSKTPQFTRRALRGVIDSDELFKRSSRQFKKARQAGGVLDQDDYADFMANFETAFSKQMDPALHPRLFGTLNLLEKRLGDDLDIEDLMLVRRNIADIGISKSKDERRLGRKLLEGFDNFVENLPGDEEWIKARRLYSRGIKTEMVENAIEKAGRRRSGLENGLRIEFRKILDNERLRKRFNPSELAAMERVVEGDFTTNTLRRLGVFGAGFGDSGQRRASLTTLAGIAGGAGAGGQAGTVGGVTGAVGVPVAGAVSQALATRRTQRAADIVRALTSGARPELPARVGPTVRRGAAALAISEAGDEEE